MELLCETTTWQSPARLRYNITLLFRDGESTSRRAADGSNTPRLPRLRTYAVTAQATAGKEAMSDTASRVVCVGEVMVELARGGDGRFALGCGGDTFNTAIYLARAGMEVAF